MKDLVTIEEFKKQVWEIEGAKIEIKLTGGLERLVRPYDFERLPDEATVDDLKERITKCLEPFVYTISPDDYCIPKILIHYFYHKMCIPKYMGYINNHKLNSFEDAEKLYNLCNWANYTDKRPKDLKSNIRDASTGICFTNTKTKEIYLALTHGWLKGTARYILDYVKKNKDNPIWE